MHRQERFMDFYFDMSMLPITGNPKRLLSKFQDISQEEINLLQHKINGQISESGHFKFTDFEHQIILSDYNVFVCICGLLFYSIVHIISAATNSLFSLINLWSMQQNQQQKNVITKTEMLSQTNGVNSIVEGVLPKVGQSIFLSISIDGLYCIQYTAMESQQVQ